MSRRHNRTENTQNTAIGGRRARRQEKKLRRSNGITNVLLIICLAVFIFAGYKLATILLEYKSGSDEYAALEQYAPTVTEPAQLIDQLQQALTQTTAAPEPEQEADEPASAPAQEASSPLPSMDFAQLAAINPDVKAWVTIFDTNINYPVVQTDNDETYLHRTFEGKSNTSGCLFISQYNSFLQDANTVIYGHNMKNGSMFHDLVKFKDEAFFDSHKLGLLYTPEKTYWLEIVAAYTTPAASGFDQVLFSSPEAQTEYFTTMLERSDYEVAYSVDELGPILTLSTCTYEYDDARYVVHARIRE